jgi:hypothetical protein
MSRFIVIIACTLAGAAWLYQKGPVPVIRITTPLPEPAPFWYMLSAFPILGILIADLIDLYRRHGICRSTLELAVQICLLVGISNLRLGIRLPISGHSLLVSYFLARRFLVGPVTPGPNKVEIALGVCVLIAVSYPKLLWWRDPVTLLVGTIGGLMLAVLSRVITGSWKASLPLPEASREN